MTETRWDSVTQCERTSFQQYPVTELQCDITFSQQYLVTHSVTSPYLSNLLHTVWLNLISAVACYRHSVKEPYLSSSLLQNHQCDIHLISTEACHIHSETAFFLNRQLSLVTCTMWHTLISAVERNIHDIIFFSAGSRFLQIWCDIPLYQQWSVIYIVRQHLFSIRQ